MQKLHLLSFLFLFSSTQIFSQSKTLDLSNRIDARYGIQKMFDAKEFSKRNASSYPDVDGSPYWSEKWLKSFVQTTNGNVYTVQQGNLDLKSQEFEFLSDDGIRFSLDASSIAKVAFMKGEDSMAYAAVFIVLPDHLEQHKSAFFRICNNGKVQLLALQKMIIKSAPPDPFVTTTSRYFEKKNFYVIYKDDRIIPIKGLDQESIISLLNITSEDSDWLKKNRNKLKTEEEAIKFLDQYNGKAN